MRLGYDAAYAVYPKGFDATFFYIGGDTPHVWTNNEVAAITTRYKAPIYTRYPTTGHNGVTDAQEALSRVLHLGQPQGTVVMLDFETGVDSEYVRLFNLTLQNAGYPLVIYGSESTLFQNPEPSGGYWLAKPGNVDTAGNPILDSRSVITQYHITDSYDYNIISDSVPLWGKDDENMLYLVAVTNPPAGVTAPGVYLLSPAGYHHVVDPTDEIAFQQAGAKMISLSYAQHVLLLGGGE